MQLLGLVMVIRARPIYWFADIGLSQIYRNQRICSQYASILKCFFKAEKRLGLVISVFRTMMFGIKFDKMERILTSLQYISL